MSKGYGKLKGIKVISWNKGSSYFVNKIGDIKEVINSNKPHILTLSEANINSDDLNYINIDDYILEYDNLLINNNRSRSCMLIHNDIKYERLYEYKPKMCSIIVIEVGIKYKKNSL